MQRATLAPANELSLAARERFEQLEGAPLMRCAWRRTMMIHFAMPPEALQPLIPFPLDCINDRAWVSIVPFSLCDLRLGSGGRLGELAALPLRDHNFCNVRTYVDVEGEPGIYFLAEWVSSPLAVRLGPLLYGLPYRDGTLGYRHDHEDGYLAGTVRDPDSRHILRYDAPIDHHADFKPCTPGSLDAFLMERYTAYTHRAGIARRFRIWHEPWPQARVNAMLHDTSLLELTGNWLHSARAVCANYSPGAEEVWIARPRRVR